MEMLIIESHLGYNGGNPGQSEVNKLSYAVETQLLGIPTLTICQIPSLSSGTNSSSSGYFVSGYSNLAWWCRNNYG